MFKLLIASFFATCGATSAFAQVATGGGTNAVFNLPPGTVLMFDVVPKDLPSSWKSCGYIRVQQGDKKDGLKADRDYSCVIQTDGRELPK